MSGERSADIGKVGSCDLSAPPSEKTQAFIRSYTVEEVQKLARSLLRDGGSAEQREQLVHDTYESVTRALAKFPTDRDDDVQYLASLVKALFALGPIESDDYGAEDVLCSDIGDVLFRNRENGSEVEFIYNLLSAIQRIGVLANREGEDSDKNLDANEEFLTLSAEEFEAKLRVSQREFFHRI
jgi:hypothetical protein